MEWVLKWNFRRDPLFGGGVHVGGSLQTHFRTHKFRWKGWARIDANETFDMIFRADCCLSFQQEMWGWDEFLFSELQSLFGSTFFSVLFHFSSKPVIYYAMRLGELVWRSDLKTIRIRKNRMIENVSRAPPKKYCLKIWRKRMRENILSALVASVEETDIRVWPIPKSHYGNWTTWRGHVMGLPNRKSGSFNRWSSASEFTSKKHTGGTLGHAKLNWVFWSTS